MYAESGHDGYNKLCPRKKDTEIKKRKKRTFKRRGFRERQMLEK